MINYNINNDKLQYKRDYALFPDGRP